VSRYRVCVTASERILGFYSTGPKIRPADFALEQMFRAYCPHPALVIVDVRPECEEIPTQAYVTVETLVEVCDSFPLSALRASEVVRAV
jgi:26S proteasome regulatory subunit N8